MTSIDIRTTQNVTISYELASLRERFLAAFIDIMIVAAITLSMSVVVYVVFGDIEGESSWNMLVRLLPITGFMFYQLLSELLAGGQSWGKKAIGIKVVRLDGQEAGLSEYLLRAVFHIVDTFFTIGIVGALLVSSSSKRQRLGDLTANTTVIRVRPQLLFNLDDILNIKSIDEYEPVYPQVRRLNESDMLLIKNVERSYRHYRNNAYREAVDELVAKLQTQLELEEVPENKVVFLQTLVKDYIVLTR